MRKPEFNKVGIIAKKRYSRERSLALTLVSALLIAFSLSFLSPEARGSTGSRDLEKHLEQAQEFFRKALELDRQDPDLARDYYAKAIMHFEYLVNKGKLRNGRLFYNIGNAYFRLGDIGRAVLNYKRAELYIPNDPNLKQNLEYARSMRKDKIEARQREKVYKTLFFLHYDLPSKVKAMIFSISFGLIWILAIFRLLCSAGWLKVLIVVFSIIAGMFLVSLIVEDVSISKRPEGVIVADEVVARKGDAETYQPAFKEPLHSGTEFFLLESREGWLHIELDNGATCWVPPGTAEFVLLK